MTDDTEKAPRKTAAQFKAENVVLIDKLERRDDWIRRAIEANHELVQQLSAQDRFINLLASQMKQRAAATLGLRLFHGDITVQQFEAQHQASDERIDALIKAARPARTEAAQTLPEPDILPEG